MSNYQEQITRHSERIKMRFEEVEQASEWGMARMLELSDQDFKVTVINSYIKGANG